MAEAGYAHQLLFRVRRDYIFEDAFAVYRSFQHFDATRKFKIVFIDEHGMEEMGIDAGGLFKEFMTKLTEKIFDPQLALFVENEVDRKHFPNFLSAFEDPENFRHFYHFSGMIVGKALYEGVLLKCRFARFFLNKIVSKSNQVDDLKAIDQQLYDNLMQVKYYEDSPVEDLGLTMTVA